ncbi:MmgE/PrpD family protein [Amycolatopsis pithecellobii]|uniref:MmgE/PrpD family protein n=1 Tax=Amycolatopsis pithecellobii TaxID=664692 RepID=A0A6N7YQT1_9PSEU|nr:MmgE/PrpD family protein [Amycolatopsis pithecellobii]MTD54342.1 hypothetical protein [Amycolatopsis pithecellobii]
MLTRAIVSDIEERLPDVGRDVLDKAALCVLDALACSFGGRDFAWSVAANALIDDVAGPSTVWSRGTTHRVLDAIYVNSVHAHSIVQEDMHPASRSHAGTMVVPAVLALGESLGSSGRQVLEAVIAGYEALARVAAVMTTPDFIARGLRPSSMFGPFGTAMAAAHLLGLDREQKVDALGLAGSSASGTTAWAYGGTPDVYFQNGAAARAGVLAAQLAAQRVAGTAGILEGPSGLLQAFCGVSPGTPVAVGETGRWAVSDVYFKAFPSCAFTQEAIEATRRLTGRGLRGEQVAEAVVETYGMGKRYPGCDNGSSLDTTLERQMSNQFGVAAMLVDGELGLDRYLGPLHPPIGELAKRIFVEEHADLEARYPATPTVRVRVTTEGGEVLREEVRGGAYLTADGVIAKFRKYASPALSGERIDGVISAVGGLAENGSLTALSRQLRPVG